MSIAVMGIAALVAWVVTALGGFVMLGQWIRRGGLRQQRSGATRFPAGLVFSHFMLAAGGLVVWIAYLLTGQDWLAWVAFVLLIPVALRGFILLRGGSRSTEAARSPPARRRRCLHRLRIGGDGTGRAAPASPSRHRPRAVRRGHRGVGTTHRPRVSTG